MRRRAGPVIEISVFAPDPEISVTEMKILPYEHSQPGDRDETCRHKNLRFRDAAAKIASRC